MQTDRLDMIISYINCDVAADIGTDHGYIPVELVCSQRAKRVIATDVRRGPLDAAKRRIEKNGCADRIELRLGSGLLPIEPGECETIIISGMGGELICDILARGESVAKAADCLLLQPMNSQDMLRKFLYTHGYEIIKEDIAVEGFKVYNLIIATSGRAVMPEDEFFLHLPQSLCGHRYFPQLLEKKKREFSKILNGLGKAKIPHSKEIERYKELYRRVCELEGEL